MIPEKIFDSLKSFYLRTNHVTSEVHGCFYHENRIFKNKYKKYKYLNTLRNYSNLYIANHEENSRGNESNNKFVKRYVFKKSNELRCFMFENLGPDDKFYISECNFFSRNHTTLAKMREAIMKSDESRTNFDNSFTITPLGKASRCIKKYFKENQPHGTNCFFIYNFIIENKNGINISIPFSLISLKQITKRKENSFIGKHYLLLKNMEPNDFYYYWEAIFKKDGKTFRSNLIFGLNFFNEGVSASDTQSLTRFTLSPSMNRNILKDFLNHAVIYDSSIPFETYSSKTILSESVSPDPNSSEPSSPEYTSSEPSSPEYTSSEPSSPEYTSSEPNSTEPDSPEYISSEPNSIELNNSSEYASPESILSEFISSDLNLSEFILHAYNYLSTLSEHIPLSKIAFGESYNNSMNINSTEVNTNHKNYAEYKLNMENFYNLRFNGAIIGTIKLPFHDYWQNNNKTFGTMGYFLSSDNNNNNVLILNNKNQLVGKIIIEEANLFTIYLSNNQIYQECLMIDFLLYEKNSGQLIGVFIRSKINGLIHLFLLKENNSISFLLNEIQENIISNNTSLFCNNTDSLLQNNDIYTLMDGIQNDDVSKDNLNVNFSNNMDPLSQNNSINHLMDGIQKNDVPENNLSNNTSNNMNYSLFSNYFDYNQYKNQ